MRSWDRHNHVISPSTHISIFSLAIRERAKKAGEKFENRLGLGEIGEDREGLPKLRCGSSIYDTEMICTTTNINI